MISKEKYIVDKHKFIKICSQQSLAINGILYIYEIVIQFMIILPPKLLQSPNDKLRVHIRNSLLSK